MKDLRSLFKKNNLKINDLHSANIGILNKQPVVVDYGYGEMIKKT